MSAITGPSVVALELEVLPAQVTVDDGPPPCLIDRATLEVTLNIAVKDSSVRIAGRDPAGRFGILTLA